MPAIKLREFTCPGCGLRETRKARQNTLYCTRACWQKNCAGKYLRTGKEVSCPTCGKNHYIRGSSVLRGSKYCSSTCYESARGIKPLLCAQCGRSFTPSGNNTSARFCSQKCSKTGPENPQWAGGLSGRKLLADDKQWRAAVFERDNYTCIICDQRGGRLTAHHKDGYHWCKERRLDISNGVTLCLNCHRDFHTEYGTHRNTEKQWQRFTVTRVDFAA